MPPPTLFDPWLANRRFGLVIDAGSSGSRIQLYSWRDARVVQTELSAKALASLPIVDKGTKDADDSVLKIEPGLSTFGPDPEGIFKYLEPLIKHAKSEIPPHLHAETPLFLLATAGMRLLPEGQQNSILRKVCQYFRDYTDFKIDKSGPLGPCGASVRIISGEEEGVFGWIAINYLMESFPSISSRDEKKAENTYGFLDMGGASTQIAFEPSSDAQDVHPVQLRLLNGKDVTHNVFVATWLGYGTNQARQRYVGKLVDDYEEMKGHHENMIPDPCLPMDLKRFESSPRAQGSTEHSHKQHTLIGSGNFTKCLDQTAPLLNRDAPCVDIPCLFGGKRVPTIDFSVSRFIGVSEYWYSSEDIFGLGGAYDFVQYERAATDFCMQEWGKIRAHHDKLKETTTKGGAGGHVGGDGELERDGKIVALGNWNPRVELSRLELQCFKAAWIVNVLHEGLGMPRIVDPGGNVTNTKAVHQVNESAKGKGLGKPTFQSADTIDDTAITWTLGKMVLEASKEIQSSSGHSLPIPDPLLPSAEPDTIAIGNSGFFDYLGHRASHHLPPALKGDILGFPIIMIMFYAMFCSIIAFAYMRMKKRIRITVRRLLRQTGLRQDREDAMEMNGGNFGEQAGSPTTPLPLSFKLRNFFATLTSTIRSSQSQHQRYQSLHQDGYHSEGSIYPRPANSNRIAPRVGIPARVNGTDTYSPSSMGSSPPRSAIDWTPTNPHNGDQDHGRAVPPRALYNSLSTLTRSQNSASSLSLYPRSTAGSSLMSRSGAQTPVDGHDS